MITTVDNNRFKLLHYSRSDNYLWIEQPSGKLVISDHSADDLSDQPESVLMTDDGVLYLDVKKLQKQGGFFILHFGRDKGSDPCYSLPLLTEQGTSSHTFADHSLIEAIRLHLRPLYLPALMTIAGTKYKLEEAK